MKIITILKSSLSKKVSTARLASHWQCPEGKRKACYHRLPRELCYDYLVTELFP